MSSLDEERARIVQAEVGRLLSDLCAGQKDAFNSVLKLVYEELRREARERLRAERRALDPAELVHEAYLRLVDQRQKCWQNRAHFMAVAATAMRRVLTDEARRRTRQKRGGRAVHVPVFDLADRLPAPSIEPSALDAALDDLTEKQPRLGRVLELRGLAGLTIAETAEVLRVSESTVKRDWTAALEVLRKAAADS